MTTSDPQTEQQKTGTSIIQPISTRDLVLGLAGKVDALAEMMTAFINRKPWYHRVVMMLAENEQGQLKYVALIILGLAAIANGLAFSGYGFSIAEAMTQAAPIPGPAEVLP